ncbi:MAG: hypothetical protein ABWX82_11495 [Leifsonia sp.]
MRTLVVVLGLGVLGLLLVLGVALAVQQGAPGESVLSAPVSRLIDEASAFRTRSWLVPVVVVALVAYVAFMVGAGVVLSIRRRRRIPAPSSTIEEI